MAPLFTNEQIYKFIPQRPPMVMIDAVFAATNDQIKTGLTIKPENLFIRDGLFQEAGIIEHIAQSAAAMYGINNYQSHSTTKMAFIGEIKNFLCNGLPKAGDQLITKVQTVMQMQNITLVEADTRINGLSIASCQLKIAIPVV